VDGDLSHVVQESGPSQAITVFSGKAQFVSDEVGISTNALRMPASTSIVGTKSSDQSKDLNGRRNRLSADPVIESVNIPVELASRVSPVCYGKTRRGPIRKQK
jgi:hypothetical protein